MNKIDENVENEETFEQNENQEQLKWTKVIRRKLNVHLTQLYRPQSQETRSLFEALERQISYLGREESKIRVFGKWHPIPRQQAGYGELGLKYSFSNITLDAKPWVPVLIKIRDRVEEVTGFRYNFVLVNRYADGNDYAAEHRDDEKELERKTPIASLSLGATRDFYFKHVEVRSGKDKAIPIEKFVLQDGMLLLMKYPTNTFWFHSLPKRKKVTTVRINLTFRKIKV